MQKLRESTLKCGSNRRVIAASANGQNRSSRGAQRFDGFQKVDDLERLNEITSRADFVGSSLRIRPLRRHDEDWGFQPLLLRLSREAPAIESWHVHVEHHEGWRRVFKGSKRVGAVGRRLHP